MSIILQRRIYVQSTHFVINHYIRKLLARIFATLVNVFPSLTSHVINLVQGIAL